MAGLEPAILCSHDHRFAAVPDGFAATLHPVIQSERADLNRRSPGPRTNAAHGARLGPVFRFCTRAEWARRESNPQSDPYKRPALPVELRAATGEWGRKDLNLHQPD